MTKDRLLTLARMTLIPVGYALLVHFLFNGRALEGTFSLMTNAFLFVLPVSMGAITVLLARRERAEEWGFRIMAPWWTIFLFFGITLLFGSEGWPCLLIILPIYLLAGSVGGMIGGAIRKRMPRKKLLLSPIALLPVLVAPLEARMGTGSTPYETHTYIDIGAPAAAIWSNVTRVRTITPKEDAGGITRLLHFPRPVRAELNYEGVGAAREAIFTGGLVFHETVTEYAHEKRMTFTIKALPHEIPLSTMDEHLVVGGRYFDVLTGTYELEALAPGRYRLHLWSRFRLSTHFNFYAHWWCDRIMRDIQNNILQVEKRRAEADDRPQG